MSIGVTEKPRFRKVARKRASDLSFVNRDLRGIVEEFFQRVVRGEVPLAFQDFHGKFPSEYFFDKYKNDILFFYFSIEL